MSPSWATRGLPWSSRVCAAMFLGSYIGQLAPAHEGIELPEEYQPKPEFVAVYSATADVNLSIRKEKDENAKLIGHGLRKRNR